MPLELAGKQLVVQRDHLGVALEEVVVVAVEPHATAEIEGARLTADVRPAFDERDREAAPRELAARDEPGNSRADDGDARRHARRGCANHVADALRRAKPPLLDVVARPERKRRRRDELRAAEADRVPRIHEEDGGCLVDDAIHTVERGAPGDS